MRLLPHLLATLLLATLSSGCTDTRHVTSADDLIAAVDYRAADEHASPPRYREPSDNWTQKRKTFTSEEWDISLRQRVSRFFCLSKSWSGNQTKPDPFGGTWQGWRDGKTRLNYNHTVKVDNAELSRRVIIMPYGGRSWLFPQSSLSDYDQSTQRQVIRSTVSRLGLPFSAMSMNHHGCRDAMALFYKTSGGVVAQVFYKQSYGDFRLDESISESKIESLYNVINWPNGIKLW